MKQLLVLGALLIGFAVPLCAGGTSACGAKAPDSLVKTLLPQAPGLKADVLKLALSASECAAQRGLVKRRELLSVIDYSLPSSQPRFFIFDVKKQKLLFREL